LSFDLRVHSSSAICLWLWKDRYEEEERVPYHPDVRAKTGHPTRFLLSRLGCARTLLKEGRFLDWDVCLFSYAHLPNVAELKQAMKFEIADLLNEIMSVDLFHDKKWRI
jgi:hypothetical protein